MQGNSGSCSGYPVLTVLSNDWGSNISVRPSPQVSVLGKLLDICTLCLLFIPSLLIYFYIFLHSFPLFRVLTFLELEQRYSLNFCFLYLLVAYRWFPEQGHIHLRLSSSNWKSGTIQAWWLFCIHFFVSSWSLTQSQIPSRESINVWGMTSRQIEQSLHNLGLHIETDHCFLWDVPECMDIFPSQSLELCQALRELRKV